MEMNILLIIYHTRKVNNIIAITSYTGMLWLWVQKKIYDQVE